MTDQRRGRWLRGDDRGSDREPDGVAPGKRPLTLPAKGAAPEYPGKRTVAQDIRFNPSGGVDSFVQQAEQALNRLELAVAARDLEAAASAKSTLERNLELVRQALTAHRSGASQWQPIYKQLVAKAAPLLEQVPAITSEMLSSRSVARRGGMFSGNGAASSAGSAGSTAWDLEAARWRNQGGGATTKNEPTGPRSIPSPLLGELEAATSTPLSDVRLHGTEHGDQVASSHSARAVTIGKDIYFRDGELDLESHEGQALLGHEVAHVAQGHARGGTDIAAAKRDERSTEAAEREADSFATAFAQNRGALRWTPSVSIGAGTASRKPENHDVANASLDRQLYVADQAGKLINAPAYLFLHMADIRKSVHDMLIGRPYASGEKQVTLREDVSFAGTLLRPFEGADTLANVHRYRDWLAPLDIYALVDRNRPIFAESEKGATDEFMRGLTGPSALASAVPMAIASAFQEAISTSLARMSPRLVAATAKARAANTTVQAKDLVPSTPFDWQVAQTMLGRDGGEPTAVVAEGTLAVDPAAKVTYRKIHRFEWQGTHGGPWNAVRVFEPADANAEEVAQQILGRSSDAYRVKHIGAYFVIPEDVAATVPEAAAHRPAGGYADQTSADVALAFGPHADENAAAEAARVPPPKVTVAEPWERVDEQLRGIASTVAPLGFAGVLQATIQLHQRRKLDPAKAAAKDITARTAELLAQYALLADIAGEIGVIASQLEKLELPKDGPKGGATASPGHSVLWKLVRAATLSHLAESGRAALAEARSSRTGMVFDTLEAALGGCATQIEIVRLIGQQAEGDHLASSRVLGAGFSVRLDRLHVDVAKQRSVHVETGTVDAEAIERIAHDTEMLRMDASVVAQIGQLGQVFSSVSKMEDDNWTLFSEYFSKQPGGKATDRMNDIIEGSNTLRVKLQIIHKHWVEIQKRSIDLATSLGGAGVEDASQVARKVVEIEVLQVRWELSKIGEAKGVAEFLDAAYSEIKGIEHRRMIVQIATIVGIMIASMGVGAAVEGVALGFGASALGAQLVGLAADTTMFTVLNARLSGEPIVAAFISNLAGNLATFGALRAAKALTAAGKAVTAVKATSGAIGKAMFATAKLADLTAPVLVAGGVQFAQAEYESLLHTGHTMSLDELKQAGVQGIAMMIGAAVVHHGLGPGLDEVKGEVAGKVGRGVDRVKLNKLANDVMEIGDPVKAIELIREARTHFEAEQARFKELDKLSDDQLVAKGMSRPTVTAMGKNAEEGLTALGNTESLTVVAALGLDAVVPGHVYAGTTDQVQTVVTRCRERGWQTEQTKDGFVVHGEEATIKVIDRGSSRVVFADADADRMMAYLDKIPTVKGTLDVVVHGTADDFVLKTKNGDLHLDHRVVAAYIEKSGIKFTRIRLIACRAGQNPLGVAQHLANKLGVIVEAPTDRVWMHKDGRLTIGPSEDVFTGRFVEFRPDPSSLRDKKAAEPPKPTLRERAEAAKASKNQPSPADDRQHPTDQATKNGERTAAGTSHDPTVAHDETLALGDTTFDVAAFNADSESYVKAGLQIADPIFGERASNALKAAAVAHPDKRGELKAVQDRSRLLQASMLSVFRDPHADVATRQQKLLAIIDQLEAAVEVERGVIPDIDHAFGFSQSKVAVSKGIDDHFSNKVTMDRTGQLHRGTESLGAFRELMNKVIAANKAFAESGAAKELVISVAETSDPAIREVIVLSRKVEAQRAEKQATPPLEVQNHRDPEAVIVDVGSGESSFAIDLLPPSDRAGGPVVQTEYGPDTFDGAMTRADLGWEAAAPHTDVDSVVVFGDPLQTMDVLFGKGSVKRVFINHVNAKYSSAQYDTLAQTLLRAMAPDGRVEVQWSDQPEYAGGTQGDRGHISGQALKDTLLKFEAAAGRTVTEERAPPITGYRYSARPSTRRSGKAADKVAPSPPVPEARWIFTFK